MKFGAAPRRAYVLVKKNGQPGANLARSDKYYRENKRKHVRRCVTAARACCCVRRRVPMQCEGGAMRVAAQVQQYQKMQVSTVVRRRNPTEVEYPTISGGACVEDPAG